MLMLSSSYIYSFSLFFPFFYFVLLISILFYLLPVITEGNSTTARSSFTYVNGSAVGAVFLLLLLLLMFLVYSVQSPYFSLWMGHLNVSSVSKKTFYVLCLSFFTYFLVFCTMTSFVSRDSYDFTVANLSSTLWIYMLFLSNSLISTFFIIEVLSSILFLLLVTSAFSSSKFYSSLDISGGHFLQDSLPSSFLKSVILFFWVSLLSSLNLFIFVLLIYLKIFSFDWYLLEHIFVYLSVTSSFEQLISISIAWYVIVFSIFTKCGLAPFFFWKPAFFKGLTLNTIFFYICVFYFTIFIFIVTFISGNFFSIFYYYRGVFVLLVTIGLLVVLSLLLESFLLKTFLAVSSILNSLLVFLAMSAPHVSTLVFSSM